MNEELIEILDRIELKLGCYQNDGLRLFRRIIYRETKRRNKLRRFSILSE